MNKDSVANYTRSGFEGKVKGVLIDSLAIVEEPDANIKAKFSLNPALKNKIRHDIRYMGSDTIIMHKRVHPLLANSGQPKGDRNEYRLGLSEKRLNVL
jgi:hypothetical protein